MYSLKDKEGTIINNVREDFFKEYDCRKLIGNIDFSVAIPQTGKELFPDIEYLLWAEAKKGALTPSAFHDAFIQLIFTIGRERTFDKNLPPKFLGAFDAEKIAFIPFSAVMEAGRKIWEYYMSQKPKTYGAEPINVNASFYDIRAYFQGRDEKGKMNNDSPDQKYMSLLKDLRNAQKVLAKQIEKKVYLYGFLKGEVEIDPAAQVEELKKQVHDLQKQIKEQQKTQVNLHIEHLDTLNLGDNVENKFS